MTRATSGEIPPERAPRAEVAIDDLDTEGRGVGRVQGKVVFVAGALPGETVRARYTRHGRRFDEAVVERCLVQSPRRVEPFCPAFGRCGGCTLQHLDAAAQRAQRGHRLAQQLARVAGTAPARWLEPVRGPERAYRTRARLAVRFLRGRGVLLGFRERGGRRVADIDDCPVLVPALARLIEPLKALVATLSRPDRVPGIELSAGDDAAAVVITFAARPTAADRERLCAFGREQDVAVETRGRAGEGAVDPARPSGLSYRLPHEGLTLHFGASDFIQGNPVVNRGLVAQAMELLAPAPGSRILDLYCGIGNFALPAACRGAAVTGLEGDAGLVERARGNARANGLDDGARFEVADLHEADLAQRLREAAPGGVLLDPPREGAPEVVEALLSAPPSRVVYVACDPATMARDIGRLVGAGGFRLEAAGIADMFPHTGHIESIALLTQPADVAPR